MQKSSERKNRNREKRYWNDRTNHSRSFGCSACPEAEVCGGLSVQMPIYSCLDNCCDNPKECDTVCRNNPDEFVMRLREIDGFDLKNVLPSRAIARFFLPSVVPILYHGSSRTERFEATMVCMPLYSMIRRRRRGKPLKGLSSVLDTYRIGRSSRLILTGTAEDVAIERWWNLGRDRREAIRGLCDAGVEMVTTPNFSLFADRPRWDDLYSMKRIEITYDEFLAEGMRTALHLNARTERDWERWTEYLETREEVKDVTFEFATGAGRSGRLPWYVHQLSNLGRNVGRPIHLVVRSAPIEILPSLADAFSGVTYLDTNAFMKTVHRQRGNRDKDGRITWHESRTLPGEPLDSLLMHNWVLVKNSVTSVLEM